jgi:uncharacterized protein (TIRG00374 family)
VTAGRLVRAAVAVGLTALLLWRSDPAQVWQVTAAADARWIVAAVLLVLVDRALMAYRWYALLAPIDAQVRPPLATVMRVFFVSTFVGTFLPASIGGDLVRAYQLSQHAVSRSASLASVLMDRLLGVVSIVLLALAGLSIAAETLGGRPITLAVIGAAIACVVALSVVFDPAPAAAIQRVVDGFGWPRVQGAVESLATAVRQYAGHRRGLVLVLTASLAVQAIRIAQAYALGRALGIDAGLLIYAAAIPLILLIMLLPITVNGLGTSQAAFVWFFGRAGVDSAAAFALSILFVGLGIVGNLPGSLLYAFGSQQPQKPQSS